MEHGVVVVVAAGTGGGSGVRSDALFAFGFRGEERGQA
jgi:hypothetical protein